MLEAIIAFFPVKEDHDAIGSIDYPAKLRSKLAINSQKWACESCGLIKNTISEKKPKVTASVNSEVDSPNIIEDNKSDNISEVSGVQKPETHHELRTTKKIKAKKIIDDRKSHISYPVEGIIIEDINEDEDIEEKSRDDESDLKSKTNILKLNTEREIEINPIDYLRKDSNIEQNDFVDYLIKLRSSQYNNVDNTNKDVTKTLEQSCTVNLINKSQITKEEEESKILKEAKNNENTNSNLREVILNSPFRKKSNSTFKQMNNDESEFYNILKTIQFHQSNKYEEIEKDLQQTKFINNSHFKILKDLSLTHKNEINKILTSDNPSSDDNKNNIISHLNLNSNGNEQIKNVLKAMDILNQKDKLETILKKKNNALKYFVREKYKDAKKIRQRLVNLSMIIIISLVFLIYYLVKVYFA